MTTLPLYLCNNEFVKATPMKLGDYNKLQGSTKDTETSLQDDGFLIEPVAIDTKQGTVPTTRPSWIYQYGLDKFFRANGALTFGDALVALKAGKRVARSGWNGKGMWLVHVSPETYDVGSKTAEGADALLPWVAMKTADNKLVPWLASQTDVLAEDWSIL